MLIIRPLYQRMQGLHVLPAEQYDCGIEQHLLLYPDSLPVTQVGQLSEGGMQLFLLGLRQVMQFSRSHVQREGWL